MNGSTNPPPVESSFNRWIMDYKVGRYDLILDIYGQTRIELSDVSKVEILANQKVVGALSNIPYSELIDFDPKFCKNILHQVQDDLDVERYCQSCCCTKHLKNWAMKFLGFSVYNYTQGRVLHIHGKAVDIFDGLIRSLHL